MDGRVGMWVVFDLMYGCMGECVCRWVMVGSGWMSVGGWWLCGCVGGWFVAGGYVDGFLGMWVDVWMDVSLGVWF